MAMIQQDSNSFARVLKQTTIQLPEPQAAPLKLDQPRLVWPAARVLTWVLRTTTMGWRMVLTG